MISILSPSCFYFCPYPVSHFILCPVLLIEHHSRSFCSQRYFAFSLTLYLLHIPQLLHTSQHLITPPSTSPHLPTLRHTSQYLPHYTSPYLPAPRRTSHHISTPVSTSAHLSAPPSTSLHLPEPPRTSPHLPTPRHTSQHLTTFLLFSHCHDIIISTLNIYNDDNGSYFFVLVKPLNTDCNS